MPRSLTCPLGHVWSLPENPATVVGMEQACPVCGSTVISIHSTRVESPADPSPTLISLAGKDNSLTVVSIAPSARKDRTLPPESEFRTRADGQPGSDNVADDDATRAEPDALQGISTAALQGWPSVSGYEVRAELGRGGMGVVYRALDCKRGQEVALKTLQGMSPQALVRFKNEFRLLADMSHPNLVSLYELVSDGQQWFFAMELLQGVDFLSYVRAGPAVPLAEAFQRLRSAMAQLTEGVLALHEAGKLHRDLKPNNVLVSSGGRVVILDFGLAAELKQRDLYQDEEQHIVGTVGYMSPEQAACRTLSPATDWYSVGVILYEALTGRLPFTGSMFEILRAKEEQTPRPPHEIAAGVPEDLDALCVEMLQHDPEKRPAGQDVLRRLKNLSSQANLPESQITPQENLALLGRDAHLKALADGLETMRGGRTVVVYISGRSGMGKSSLIQAFLDGLPRDKEVVILAGQCYEKESVPYKALDSMVDSLSRYLARLSTTETAVLLPRDVQPLTRVFPVLRHLEAVAPVKPALEIPDPQEIRRRAFTALRELLGRLGDRATLVMSIDDLQWGDIDSLAPFFELLRPPDPPRFLLLGSYRSEEMATSPFLQALLAPREGSNDSPSSALRRDLVVDVLPPAEANELAVRLFGAHFPGKAEVEAIARESGGNPLFIYELVQHARAAAEQPGAARGQGLAGISLSEVLWSRIQRAPEDARRLLEILAVGGRPMRQADVLRAAEAGPDYRTAQAYLRSKRLLRASGALETELLTTYHDRVRETITAHLPPAELQRCHHRLAHVLEESGHAEPDALALHFLGARETDKAITYYGAAADKAMAALAFDRAAEFYQSILQLLPEDHPERPLLRGKRADALANARRGTEAAPEYLAAAEGAAATRALELRRKAAEQFLYSGHLDEGRAVIQKLLATMGMKLPKTPFRALVSIVYHRFLLWMRGLGYRERAPSELSPEELLRLDTCWGVSLGLGHVDPIRGAEFHIRYLLLALRAGEPSRILRGLAIEAGQNATGGGRSHQRTEDLLRMTRDLADRVQQPYGFGMTWLGTGAAAFLEGRWKDTRDHSERAEKILREECVGAACERNEANFYAIRSLEFLGELTELSRRLPALLEDARDRGDLYAATNLTTRLSYFVSLMNDRPEPAQENLRSAIERWSRESFFLQHYFELYAQMDISHYCGDFQGAWDFLKARWPALKRSLILRVQSSRITVFHVRARSALGLAAVPSTSASERKKLLQLAEQQAAAVAREDMGWSNPIAQLLRAGVASIQGRTSQALHELETAEAGFLAADMALYAAVTRRRIGQLTGGGRGKELVKAADRWMLEQSIKNPARWTTMYAPGFPD
jgi:eukaryotic-like serine/threonine-protein kinase